MLAAFKSRASNSPKLDSTVAIAVEQLCKERIDPLIQFFETEKSRHLDKYQQLSLENAAIKKFLEEGTPIDSKLMTERLESELVEAKKDKEKYLLEAASRLKSKKERSETLASLLEALMRIKPDYLKYGEIRIKQVEKDLFTKFLELIKDSKRIKPLIEGMISKVVIIDAVPSAKDASEDAGLDSGIQKLKAEKTAKEKTKKEKAEKETTAKDKSGEKTSLLSDFDGITPYGATGSSKKP